MRMDKRLKILTVLTAIAIMTVAIVYAYVSWYKKFYWSAEFMVYQEDKSTPWEPGDEPLGTGAKNFWVVNIGNISITVSVTNEDAKNCTVYWSSKSQTINPGAGVWFNLTITPTIDPSGYYSFKFTKTG